MAPTFGAGLATATLLALFIVPVLWNLVMIRKERGFFSIAIVKESD